MIDTNNFNSFMSNITGFSNWGRVSQSSVMDICLNSTFGGWLLPQKRVLFEEFQARDNRTIF